MTAEEQTPGGVGIQIQGEWTHRFSSTVSGMANVAYATQYFPQIAANIAVTKYFKNDWELDIHAGYRRTTDSMKTL